MTTQEREEHEYKVAEMAKATAVEVARALAEQVSARLNAAAGSQDGHKSPCQHAQATRWYAMTVLAALGGAVIYISVWAITTYAMQSRRLDSQEVRLAATESTQSADMREIKVTLGYMQKDIASVSKATGAVPH